METPGTTYDVLIRIPGFTGRWDEQRHGIIIPFTDADLATARLAAARIRAELTINLIPSTADGGDAA